MPDGGFCYLCHTSSLVQYIIRHSSYLALYNSGQLKSWSSVRSPGCSLSPVRWPASCWLPHPKVANRKWSQRAFLPALRVYWCTSRLYKHPGMDWIQPHWKLVKAFCSSLHVNRQWNSLYVKSGFRNSCPSSKTAFNSSYFNRSIILYDYSTIIIICGFWSGQWQLAHNWDNSPKTTFIFIVPSFWTVICLNILQLIRAELSVYFHTSLLTCVSPPKLIYVIHFHYVDIWIVPSFDLSPQISLPCSSLLFAIVSMVSGYVGISNLIASLCHKPRLASSNFSFLCFPEFYVQGIAFLYTCALLSHRVPPSPPPPLSFYSHSLICLSFLLSSHLGVFHEKDS